MKVELAAPRVVDRTTFQAELAHFACPAGGFQWSRLTAR